MALIATWTNFLGQNNRVNPRRLPEGVGQICHQFAPDRADIRLAPEGSLSAGLGTAGTVLTATAYPYGGSPPWLWWDNLIVHVVPTLNPNDTSGEIFYTGDSAPKRTTYALALPATPAPAASVPLGIPAPSAQFNVATLAAGSGPLETRSYIDTFVTSDGLKEGAPNTLPRTVSVAGGTTMTLGSGGSFAAVPGGYTDTTIRRVYVSTSGGEYLLCDEGLASAASLTDSLSRTTVLASGGDTSKPAWLEPLGGMIGLTTMWNGMVAGFRGNQVLVCEPYKPWAWPAEYRITLHGDIVGLAAWHEALLVSTTKRAYVIAGASPLALNPTPLDPETRSGNFNGRPVVSTGDGVCWAGQGGFFFIGDGFPPTNISKGFLTEDQWTTAFGAVTLHSQRLRDRVAFIGGLLNNTTPFFANATIFNPRRAQEGFVTARLSSGSVVGTVPDGTQSVLIMNGSTREVWSWYGGNAGASVADGYFRTKTIRHAKPANAGALMVSGTPASGTICVAEVFADGVSLGSYSVANERPVTLPGGYKAREFYVQVRITSTSAVVNGVFLAEDAADFP